MRQPLLVEEQKNKQPSKFQFNNQMSPITRYNVVVDSYNIPCNMIDGKFLERIPESQFYQWIFVTLTKFRGKIVYTVVCLLPGINLFTLLISIFFCVYYWCSIYITRQNAEKITDPFKKMTFDPELCCSMNCDYYLFNIELKQLQGFSLNYQENVSDRLNLKKERGKTSLLIYNAAFWASYSYFDKWKMPHSLPLIFSFLTFCTINILLILLVI